MSAPVHSVTRYKVGIIADVEAKVEGELSFTDAEVREWAGIEDDGEALDPEPASRSARRASSRSPTSRTGRRPT